MGSWVASPELLLLHLFSHLLKRDTGKEALIHISLMILRIFFFPLNPRVQGVVV